MRRVLATVLLALAPMALAQKTPAKKFDPAEDINKARPDARKVTFTTDEGTWMSLDLSPDGSTLAFDLLGDIYTVPVAGGKAKAITRGPAFDWHPRFSPDGKSIAFTSDRSGIDNLWLMSAGGGNPRSPIAPSTLWKRRFPHARGARPLHCSMKRRGKCA